MKYYGLLLYLTLVLSEFSECPRYQCKDSSQIFNENTCVTYSSNIYYISPCKSGSCPPALGTSNSTCTALPNAITVESSFPGEKCTNSSSCLSGNCMNYECKGADINQPCISTYDCSPGLYCSPASLCIKQLSIGSQGCSNDFSCTNQAGCNFQLDCIKYFSLKTGTPVSSCEPNGVNLLCSSGMCSEIDGKYICIDVAQNVATSPYKCTAGSLCTSRPDKKTGEVFETECSCGLNPKGDAYCGLFYGDDYAKEFVKYFKEWVGSKYVLKCNGLARFDAACMQSWWGKKYYELLYYYLVMEYYPFVAGADECTMKVYLPDVYSAKEKIQDDSGILMEISMLLGLNLIL